MNNSGLGVAANGAYMRARIDVGAERGIDGQSNREFWRQAAREWWARRTIRIEAHMRRVQRRIGRKQVPSVRVCAGGKRPPRPVWCVELKRSFQTVSAAAAYVNRTPSNIVQAITRRGHCGKYTWEDYDPRRHGSRGA